MWLAFIVLFVLFGIVIEAIMGVLKYFIVFALMVGAVYVIWEIIEVNNKKQ
jgi:hypothetical protein